MYAVNTKAEIRFHVESADWLPQRVKDRLLTMVSPLYLQPIYSLYCIVFSSGLVLLKTVTSL